MHVGETCFNRHLVLSGVEAKHAHTAGLRAQQIEEAFDRCRFARAVAPKKSVATPRLNGEVQSVDRFDFAVAALQAVCLNHCRFDVHGSPPSFPASADSTFRAKCLRRSLTRPRKSASSICR